MGLGCEIDFVDRYDKRYVIMASFLIQAVAMLTLAHYNHIIILYLDTFAFGLTMGSIIMMQSLITGECFGLFSFARPSNPGTKSSNQSSQFKL